MNKLKFLMLLIIITNLSTAQDSNHKTKILRNNRGIIESVEFDKSDNSYTIPNSSKVFFKEWLNISSNVQFVNVPQKLNGNGFTHEHYDQYCNGIKVEEGGYNFHFMNGVMYFAHGHYIETKGINTKPDIDSVSAYKKFAHYKQIPFDSIINFKAELDGIVNTMCLNPQYSAQIELCNP
jgi:bacillolysin